MSPRNIVLIGATGSIGRSTLRVIAANRGKLRLVGIANRGREDELEAIARDFDVPHRRTFCRHGMEGLLELATLPEADVVVMAANGTVGLRPALAAIEAGKALALASKEILVLGGQFVMEAARRRGVRILPVDSEHNAIFQCLEGCRHGARQIRRLILTASGGPFRQRPLETLASVTPAEALRHPNWSMGPKVTVDSSTMANKGLEMMEARWLFDVEPRQVEVVIHPQSVVHSMVEFIDGSTLAQLSPPSMTFAIQHALLYPERADGGVDAGLDLTRPLRLDFETPDLRRFPCLTLARRAMEAGGVAGAVFNAANEVAVDAFLGNKLPYLAIPDVIAHTLETVSNREAAGLDDLLTADAEARETAAARIGTMVPS
jgi:1-deoxy-D-xylulose-5-phosphate reductoisomerase